MKRLGKSVSDVTPHAPTGATNAAFDLTATVIDPDGPPDGGGGGGGSGGILPPTGIALKWTERLIGDYNLDGQVNVQDLAPLGINWERTVAYDAAALHGGIAYWPTGGPLDDGGSVYPDPPATTSGAANWRKARVDGKEDGLLNEQDITPIAVHWGEQSAGYRVYAKLPGETAFLLLPNPDDASSPLTIPRSKTFPVEHTQADPTRPASFNFSYGDDVTALPDGRYEFYLAAYGAATDADGPASPHIALNVSAGEVNQVPVARLSLNPSFAGAPAVVTLDALLSSDPDGSIVEYIWDFDGSGSTDWSTADPVPVSVCGGEVDTITPGPGSLPSTVTVTYHQGHAEYLYPRVTVVDDKSAIAARSTKLGVSGWVRELMSSSVDALDSPGEVKFKVMCVEEDPFTGELVVAGYHDSDTRFGDFPDGVYIARRKAKGMWESELACDATTPAIAQFNQDADGGLGRVAYGAVSIAWNADHQPILVPSISLELNFASKSAVFTSVRQPSSTWITSMFYAGDSPPFASPSGAGLGSVVYLEPGRFVAMGSYVIQSGMPPTSQGFLGWYDNGGVAIDFPGTNPDGKPWSFNGLAQDSNGAFYLRVNNTAEHAAEHCFEMLRRNGINNWEWLLIPVDQVGIFTGLTWNPALVIYDNNDRGFLTYDKPVTDGTTAWYIVRMHSASEFYHYMVGSDLDYSYGIPMKTNGTDTLLFTETAIINGNYPDNYYYYFDLLEGDILTHEIIYVSSHSGNRFLARLAATSNGGKRAWWIGEGKGEIFSEILDIGQFLFTRVDPRP